MQFRAAAACRIAGIDKARFNEAVARGDYRCAPAVKRGASRVFNEDDLVTLYVFKMLVNFHGWTTSHAGLIACELREELKLSLCNQEYFALSIDLYGKVSFEREAAFPEGSILDLAEFGRLSFRLDRIREHIRGQMRAEAAILGEDEP